MSVTYVRITNIRLCLQLGLPWHLPILNVVWEDISLDFITGLPSSHGFVVILVVVDRLSKYAYLLPLKRPLTTSSVVEVFVFEVAKLHGFPNSIISYRDPLFLCCFWSKLLFLQGTVLCMSASFHPQTKVVNHCLETFLWLSLAQF